jgi:hypothetical protein
LLAFCPAVAIALAEAGLCPAEARAREAERSERGGGRRAGAEGLARPSATRGR